MGSGGDVSCGDEDGLGLDYTVFGGENGFVMRLMSVSVEAFVVICPKFSTFCFVFDVVFPGLKPSLV